jgi:hypothetical protein
LNVQVGFEFKGRQSYPILGGIVISEEFKDVIQEACAEINSHLEKKKKKISSKRAEKNWKLLLSKFRIREQLKTKYYL